jgi:hypothetical protein
MSSNAVFRVIHRRKSNIWTFENTKELSSFFLGRNISHFILIKSDGKVDRTVPLTSANGDVIKIGELAEKA